MSYANSDRTIASKHPRRALKIFCHPDSPPGDSARGSGASDTAFTGTASRRTVSTTTQTAGTPTAERSRARSAARSEGDRFADSLHAYIRFSDRSPPAKD
jgi:hypothetical protein